MERIPILRMGEFLLVTIQVDMHDQMALKLQDDLSNAIQSRTPAGRAHRHLDARNGRLIHRPHGRRHLRHRENSRRGNHPGRHAAGSRDHTGRAGPVAAGRRHGTQRRARHGAVASKDRRGRHRCQPTLQGEAPLRSEHDIVLARQQVRRLTQELKFSLVDQTKMVTAASELARNALIYGGGGTMHWEILERRRPPRAASSGSPTKVRAFRTSTWR